MQKNVKSTWPWSIHKLRNCLKFDNIIKFLNMFCQNLEIIYLVGGKHEGF
jgi:hypothetical protein